MRKKLVGILGLVGLSLVLTGCNAVQGYSVRSYQGPLPMDDYQYLNASAASGAVSAR
jgi:hypothetical protein